MSHAIIAAVSQPPVPDVTTTTDGDERYEALLRELEDSRARLAECERRAAAGDEYRTILERAPDPLFTLNLEGQYLYVNPAFAAGVGRTVAQVVGKRFWDLFPKELADQRFEALSAVARTGEPNVISVIVPQPEGGRHFVTAITPLFDAAGAVTAVLGSSKDFTHTRQTERALLDSEARLHTLSANLPDVMLYELVGPADGRPAGFSYVSPTVEHLHGCSAQDALRDGGLLYAQLLPEDAALLREREASSFATLCPFVCDVRSRHPSGELRWRQFSATPRRSADGAITWSGIETDITERKRAEQANDALEAQLLHAQKMESVGRLAGGVAHDFNNMLGVILGHADMALEDTPEDAPIREDLRQIRGAAARSADLTRQLLAFARKQAILPKALNLNTTIAGLLKMLSRLIGADVRIEWLPGDALWPVYMDPTQLDQVLMNLCVNARDAIVGAGRVTLETANVVLDQAYCATHLGVVPGDFVRVSVRDDGCGMDAGTLAQIFEPFFTTKPTGEGTGLGLSTVYGIVKQNGGVVDVRSAPGAGTTFSLFFPKCVAATGAAAGVHAPSLAPRGHETILLVEDEPTLLRVTTKLLERMGYSVLAADTPKAALRLCRAHPSEIHLLMTDIVMPDMSGYELARELLASFPHLHRLFMSGYTTHAQAHDGILSDDVSFLQKPFTVQDLGAKVREALQR